MNNLENIYKELGENICLYPFFGAFYQTNNVIPIQIDGMPNSVRPCSIVMSDRRDKWDINNGSIHNGRNTAAWKQMREDFIAGKLHEISDCRACSYNEKSNATSPRQQNNKFLSEFLKINIVEEVRNIISNDNTVHDILTLDYYPSNYCNYSCIMCAGGASTQRQVFELKYMNSNEKLVLNSADPDFFKTLDKVQIINFTGGETVLQKQVHDIMDYLIEKDLAKNIVITILTNGSSSPEKLDAKFKHFKQVIYNVSIDGIGEVVEYQRRGCKWPILETNALLLVHHRYIGTVINYVLSAVNVLSAGDFVQWAYDNNIGPTEPGHSGISYINVSPVFRVDHLGVGALPLELRTIALERLHKSLGRYNADTPYDTYYRTLVNKFISVVTNTPHSPDYLKKFKRQILIEDQVSSKPLIEVVPEWAPYFQS